MRSSPKENQSLEVKVKGISEMEFSLSIFDYTFTNYDETGYRPATFPQFRRSLKPETSHLTIKITALDQKQPLTSRLGVMDQGSCLLKIKDRDELKN